MALLLPFLLAAAGWGAESGTPTIEVTYRFSSPEPTATGKGFAIVGCDTLNRPGLPLLPFRTGYVLVPPSYRVSSVSVTPEGPARALTTSPNPGAPTEATAELPGAQPWHRAELLSLQRLNGYAVAVIRVFPVQVSATTGAAIFMPALRVKLALAPENLPGITVPRTAVGAAAARREAAALVDNPERLAEYYPAVGGADAANHGGPTQPGYLLVTTEALRPAFQPLLDRKAADGFTVVSATVEQIGATQPGGDLPEKIREFIRDQYANRAVGYVLLGGDTQLVPCRYAYVPRYGRETDSVLPCDLYYACLDGSWNRDGDSHWGGPNDGTDGGDVDLLAEVCVGRAPVDTLAEAAAFVMKTLHYETRQHQNPADALVAGEYLGHFSPGIYAQGARMFEPLLPHLRTLHVTWLDDRPHTEPQWTGADAIAAVNRQPHFVLYNGHGENDRMLRMRSKDLSSLRNSSPFLLFSVGCFNGQFDNDILSPDSIAEDLVKMPEYGAFAAIVNPRRGWFDPREEWRYSGELQLRFFERLARGGQTGLGQLCRAARHDLVGQVERSGTMPYRWCYYQITLLGDPLISLQPPDAVNGDP